MGPTPTRGRRNTTVAKTNADNHTQETDGMNTTSIQFPCPNCQARIKVPIELIGRSRTCPGCSHPFTVPTVPPEDADPKLVLLEDSDRFALGVGQRRGEKPLRTRKLYPSRQTA